MLRRRKHSVSKVLFKVSRQFHDLKGKSTMSEEEVWAEVVKTISHKNLRIIAFDTVDFKELPKYDHFLSLVQSALFERAMNKVKTAQADDHVSRT